MRTKISVRLKLIWKVEKYNEIMSAGQTDQDLPKYEEKATKAIRWETYDKKLIEVHSCHWEQTRF
jgi:hypothetical protein